MKLTEITMGKAYEMRYPMHARAIALRLTSDRPRQVEVQYDPPRPGVPSIVPLARFLRPWTEREIEDRNRARLALVGKEILRHMPEFYMSVVREDTLRLGALLTIDEATRLAERLAK